MIPSTKNGPLDVSPFPRFCIVVSHGIRKNFLYHGCILYGCMYGGVDRVRVVFAELISNVTSVG